MKKGFWRSCGLGTIILALAFFYGLSGWSQDTSESKPPVLDCGECHTCPVPTLHQSCLKTCPRTVMVHQSAAHQLAEAPDSILLDELEEIYHPVRFNHKVHARMAEMNGNCATCHHYSPKGQIPPCKECHSSGAANASLRQPNLKGAYHRQCLSCHREWSHDTKCLVCHILKTEHEVTTGVQDPTDIIGISHPVMTEPAKKTYHTPYKAGPIVTFQHKEHIDLFGFRCVDCHRRENCSYCHDYQRSAGTDKTQVQVHAVCNDCHKDAPCAKCHDTKERPGFTHNTTGWPLNPYHNKLDCWACHPTGKRISRLSKMCVNCHAGWSQENFKHAVTGLALDEAHAQIDCSGCHSNNRYDEDPVCSDCHDDGRTAKTAPPGMRVKQE